MSTNNIVSTVRRHKTSRPSLSVGMALNEREVLAAQKLRYRVFAEELGARLGRPVARGARFPGLHGLTHEAQSGGAQFRDVGVTDAEVVGEVEFAEFTPGGTLRHARWRGVRADMSPADVARD